MSFSVAQKAGPHIPTPNNTKVEVQMTGRERAIAALMGNKETPPVADPNNISPEELSAVKTPESQAKQEAAPAEMQEANPAESEQINKGEGDKSESESAEVTAKPKEDPLSTQYALLARKEKALRAKMQDLKAKEEAFKAQEEVIKAKEAEYQSKYISKDRLSTETLEVLSELGITYDQLTQLVLNAPKPEDMAQTAEMKAIKAELKAVKEAQEAAQKSAKEQQDRNYQQVLTQLRQDAKRLVDSNPDQFETIKETNSTGDVVELIERTFNEDGILLTVEEAAATVEEFLVDEGLKIARLKKIQSKLAPSGDKKPVDAKAEAPKSATSPKQTQTKTLTNGLSASRPLTARERAIAVAEGRKV